MTLLGVAEAQARLLALARPAPLVHVPLVDARGRWAAEDVFARRTQPAADLSAMDGYAVRFAEMPGPWRVVGQSAAGVGYGQPIANREAVRIFTGAPVPPGADVILVQEDAARDGDTLSLAGSGPPGPGAHIRRAGNDFRLGDRLIAAGDPIGPARIALAATGGHGTLPVRRRPRVSILSTGDELVPAGDPVTGVSLPSSNAPMLAALIASSIPADIDDRGIVRDDLDALAAAFTACAAADIIVTTGGASVGDYDLVRPALIAAGADIDFWRVAIKPGKPLMAGRLGNAIVIGLPGNPVSAYVTARLFLLPLIRHIAGARNPLDMRDRRPLLGTLGATGKREEYVRAVVHSDGVKPVDGQDSAALAALALAGALIVRPPGSPAAMPDDIVETIGIA